MPVKDLREWLDVVEKMGELKKVDGAHWDLEIGVITDLYQQKPGSPALLFDNIPGYPKGYRILANSCMSMPRIAYSLEMSPDLDKLEMVKAWRKKLGEMEYIPPREVEDGPVLENVITGDDVNCWDFPAPKLHEFDGGRFVGTGVLCITKDPDDGWVNFGAYRVQNHDEKRLGMRCSPGRHGLIHMQKWWEKGKPCPVAIVVGQDPLLYMISGIEVPTGVSEYEYAGAIRNEAVDVVKGPFTGLPIPAGAELVFEGEIHEGDLEEEGPFGEWTGYYAGGRRPEPVVRVKSISHRNDPIILVSSPAKPPSDTTYYRTPMRSAMIWNQMEGAGIDGIKGVWAHEAGAGRLMTVVSIKQLRPGHSRMAGYIAANCFAAAYCNRLTVVVDDDVDITNTNDVLWAMLTRCDPAIDLEVLKKCWSTRLDHIAYPEDQRMFNNRMVIDACTSFDKLKTAPPVATTTPGKAEEIRKKWPELFKDL